MVHHEIFLFIILSVVFFWVLNGYFRLRTAASLFLSVLIASILCFLIFDSLMSEALISLSIFVSLIYSIAKSTRDYRDDIN